MDNENLNVLDLLSLLFDVSEAKSILMGSTLDIVRLDYSIESLKEIDRYLLRLHYSKKSFLGKLFNKQHSTSNIYAATVLRIGAYVGEVIKRQLNGKANWYLFDNWIQTHPEQNSVLGGGKNLNNTILLGCDNHYVILPLAKCIKCIENGMEDNTSFYAPMIISHYRNSRKT